MCDKLLISDIKKILEFVFQNKNSAFFYSPLMKGEEVCYLFKTPNESITCDDSETIINTLNTVEELSKTHEAAYGLISYEAGYSFEEKLTPLFDKKQQIFISFHFFDNTEVFEIPTKDIDFRSLESLLNENSFDISNLKLNESQSEYENKINTIKKEIAKGNTYQVNYTLKAKFNYDGKLPLLIAQLLFKQSASYTSVINNGDDFIISFSPELFFKTEEDRIISKPMKGTIKRGVSLDDDFERSEQLKNSKKDRAENIMIVDLLRNDIGKLSKFNSVRTKSLFEIEKYETLFQMTSTVSGKLSKKSFAEIIANLYPCGSITGAPKIKTMEIINSLEKESRGFYTGTIGMIRNNDFTFNIPIRTVTLNTKNKTGELGLGSGIVWDSNPKSEFDEVKLKSKFLTQKIDYFELIETMLIEDGEVFLRENHINRLKKTAKYFLFYFDETKLRELLYTIITGLDNTIKFKLRLLLTKWGELKYNIEQITNTTLLGRIVVSNKRIDSKNRFQYFKTTNRELYNSEYQYWRGQGFDDVIFLNERDEITEGAITNIMISDNDKLYTPPIDSGLLNGCYRGHLLITEKNISEKVLSINDLISAKKLFVFNSVRKRMKINEIIINGKSYFY